MDIEYIRARQREFEKEAQAMRLANEVGRRNARGSPGRRLTALTQALPRGLRRVRGLLREMAAVDAGTSAPALRDYPIAPAPRPTQAQTEC